MLDKADADELASGATLSVLPKMSDYRLKVIIKLTSRNIDESFILDLKIEL
jgi:hypothetical protein